MRQHFGLNRIEDLSQLESWIFVFHRSQFCSVACVYSIANLLGSASQSDFDGALGRSLPLLAPAGSATELSNFDPRTSMTLFLCSTGPTNITPFFE
jgi:hypothetical protein